MNDLTEGRRLNRRYKRPCFVCLSVVADGYTVRTHIARSIGFSINIPSQISATVTTLGWLSQWLVTHRLRKQ